MKSETDTFNYKIKLKLFMQSNNLFNARGLPASNSLLLEDIDQTVTSDQQT